MKYINGVETQKFGDDDEGSETDYSLLSKEQMDELNSKDVNFTFKQALEGLHLNEMKNFEVI